MRLETTGMRIALLGVALPAAFIVTANRWGVAPVRSTAATIAEQQRAPSASAAAVTAADEHATHVAGPSLLVSADAAASLPPPPVSARAPQAAAGVRSDDLRSTTTSTAYEYGERAKSRVSLTFDAGADPGHTAEILDTLARENVVASFGLTGAWVEQNPALARRIAAEGHHIINHTWSHGSFTGLSTGGAPKTRAQRWDELDRTEAIIQRVAGVSTLPYFRPPYGDLDASVLADVGARGYAVTAMWAVDSAGWNGLSAPRIVERTLRLTTPGAILIFHVGSQSQDAAALTAIIHGLREQGYEFVPVTTLVGG